MSYIKAEIILPQELLAMIQEYADGQYLYIPKKMDNRKVWGENTDSKYKVKLRDTEIYNKYKDGTCASDLAEEYYLSLKSIQRIILKEKKLVTLECMQHV
jgi:Mor family transcriptional regulator